MLCVAKLVEGLGFRDLESFNRALLAKQLWRLVQNPSSLCFWVFQARYFANCHSMHAQPHSNASYVWNSLVHSRDIVRMRGCWRIGTGTSVDIWRDSWLFAKKSRKVDIHFGPLPAPRCVESLINQLDRTWNQDVDIILNILISSQLCDDKLIWSANEFGNFTIKSAYFLARQFLGKNVTANQNRDELWKLL